MWTGIKKFGGISSIKNLCYYCTLGRILKKLDNQTDEPSLNYAENDLHPELQTKVIIKPIKIYNDSLIAIFKQLASSLGIAIAILLLTIRGYYKLDAGSIKESLALFVIPLLVGILSSVFATLIFLLKDTKDKNVLSYNVRQKVLIPIFSSIYTLFSEIAVCVVEGQLRMSTDAQKQDVIYNQKHQIKEWTSMFCEMQKNRLKICTKGIDRGETVNAQKCAAQLTMDIQYILKLIEDYERKEEFFNLYKIISVEESSALRIIKIHLQTMLKYRENIVLQSQYLQFFAIYVESVLKYFEDFKTLSGIVFGQYGTYITIGDANRRY